MRLRPDETLKRTSATIVEVIVVERLARASGIHHRCAGEPAARCLVQR